MSSDKYQGEPVPADTEVIEINVARPITVEQSEAERVGKFVLFAVEQGYAYFTDAPVKHYDACDGHILGDLQARPYSVARIEIDATAAKMLLAANGLQSFYLHKGETTLQEAVEGIGRLIIKRPRPFPGVDLFVPGNAFIKSDQDAKGQA